MRPNLQPALTKCCRDWPLLVSLVGWAEPKLSVKRRNSKLMGTMDGENTLMKRKTRTSPLQKGADAGVQETKKRRYRG